MEILLLFLFMALIGCQNGKVTQIYPYQSWLYVDVAVESSYCVPNSIVLVGQEKDSSTAYWYGEWPAEGYELVRVITLVQDSLRLRMEQTYFNGNPSTFALHTKMLRDTVVLRDKGQYEKLREELLLYKGATSADNYNAPVYGQINDTRALYVMNDSLCKGHL